MGFQQGFQAILGPGGRAAQNQDARVPEFLKNYSRLMSQVEDIRLDKNNFHESFKQSTGKMQPPDRYGHFLTFSFSQRSKEIWKNIVGINQGVI